MAKSKKKNAITIVVLLLLVVAMGAAYFLLVNRNAEDGGDLDSEEDTSIVLSEFEDDQISELSFDNGTLSMTLVYDAEAETWSDPQDPDFPVYQSKANTMRNTVSGLSATQMVTDAPEDIAEYGLEDPAMTITLSLTDGSEFTMYIGSELVTGNGYYAMVEGDPAVYVVSRTVYNTYNIELTDLTETEDAPSFSTEQIRALLVESAEFGNFEIRYDEDNEYDYSENSMYPWTIYQPYDTPVNGDSTNITEMLGNFTSFSLADCVNYNADDLSVYGLDEPSGMISITYVPETEEEETDEESSEEEVVEEEADVEEVTEVYTLYIGDLDESGNYYYVRQEGSNAVHTMSKSTLDTKMDIDAFSMVTNLPALVFIDYCEQIDIDIEGETHQAVLEHTTETDEEGNTTRESVFYFDGVQAVDESAFRGLYQDLIGFTIETELTKEWDETAEPYVTIVFHKNTEEKTDLTVEFLPYDDDFYAVRVNGTALFGADVRDIASMVESIRSYDPTIEEE